jgi:hypothetical protein
VVIVDEGILITQTGPVHREVGNHRTGCGDPITVPGVPVSVNQILAFDLPVCRQCWPNYGGHEARRGGPEVPPGRHRIDRRLTP